MAVIKVACSKCGQRVSGDESFYGTSVQCPICTSDIRFPSGPGETSAALRAAESASGPVLPARHQALPNSGPILPSGPVVPIPPASQPAPAYHPAPVHGQATASSMPVAVLIVGIISFLFAFPLAMLLGPAAIIMGHLTLMKHNADPRLPGKGKTVTGLILGYVSLLFLVILTLLFVQFWPVLLERLEAA